MLLRLYRLLQEAERKGNEVSLAGLAAALGTSTDEVRHMLEVLAWEGKVEKVSSAGCSVEGEGCAACPLNKVCTRGVSHKQEGYILKSLASPK
jgi:Mn-dependent DtxR family transcriptional regulator